MIETVIACIAASAISGYTSYNITHCILNDEKDKVEKIKENRLKQEREREINRRIKIKETLKNCMKNKNYSYPCDNNSKVKFDNHDSLILIMPSSEMSQKFKEKIWYTYDDYANFKEETISDPSLII